MTALPEELDTPTMDVAMFEDLIGRLGEDLSRWPDDQRRAAEELLASSPAARALHEEMHAVRKALARPPISAPAGLADRIVAAAGRLTKPASAHDKGETAEQPDRPAQPGKVSPVVVLAFLLPLLTAAALLGPARSCI